ncbi:hypothetical protein BKA69DRAFT_159828 [Paraphysoderma sedebokerense]|nr:hypothetical protein BKA69DRAFT_159828 [Paraphysoderma sedebokerense]
MAATTAISLPPEIIRISIHAVKALSNFASIDLVAFQSILSTQVHQIEFFHLIIFWLNYCSLHQTEQTATLFHELIILIGHFALCEKRNQQLLRFGHSPNILQLLCMSEIKYFCDERLMDILFPTLIIACHDDEDNKKILKEEMSCDLLIQFLQSKKESYLASSTSSHSSPYSLPSSSTPYPSNYQTSSLHSSNSFNERVQIVNRIPVSLWDDMIKYFSI